jgi:hypothetical protein
MAFERGKLSLEHVPSKRLGGRSLLLTCKQCNNVAGTRLEGEMTRFEELFDFPAGTMRKATRARLKVGTAELRVEVQAEGRSIALNRLPKANRPDSEAAMQREFERGNIQGSRPSLHITFARFRYREALVGWLRAGYLVAFAALGYRYILRPDLDLVRRQIANPRDHVITVYRATLPAELPEQRRVLLVDEPRALSSLAIQMGRHLIFLPWAPPAQQFYDVLAARAGQLATETLEGQSIPWPHRPEHVLDFMDEEAA